MTKVKILGAGSIGNHLANASRHLGWEVALCDIDEAALERTRNQIYPSRYGSWDDAIRLFVADDAPTGGNDMIFVGTPPDTHLPLALAAVDEGPKAILVEKPVCPPDMTRAEELVAKAEAAGVRLLVGYDHVVGAAARAMTEFIGSRAAGTPQTLDVEFREHWGGIFAAHSWLHGPSDSYLGFWERGGGASGEHSHAINLWQHFAHAAGAGRVVSVSATLDYVRDGTVDYDRLCLLNMQTENGLVGRAIQDVVTQPSRKWARIQGSEGFAEWHCGYEPNCDAVILGRDGAPSRTERFAKSRRDDFIQELQHIEAVVAGSHEAPDLSLARGLDTMLVVAAAHESSRTRRTVRIDYSAGWSPAALQPC